MVEGGGRVNVISLVDNKRLPARKDLHTEPGLAIYILTKAQQILFDTGMSDRFLANAQRLQVEIGQVTLAVLSHHHIDHGGGLATFFAANQQAKVYLRSNRTEQLYFHFWGLFKRRVGLDEALFQQYAQRFSFINQFAEIAPDVFILTQIAQRHSPPRGNRHLFSHMGQVIQLDDFTHELILVVRENSGLVVFTGCSHHGILNMLDAVLAHFPGQLIKAVFGGFHLIDWPLINNLANSKAELEALGQALLRYPIDKLYTGHCTGVKAYQILKSVIGPKLEYFATGCQATL